MVVGEQGACVVAEGHAWLPGGHAWLWGGMHGCQGVCVVAERRHAWLRGGMHCCRGVCMLAGGLCGCGSHVWLQGGMHGIRQDTVNEREVSILLECILVVTSLPLSLYSISNFSHIFFNYPYPHLK